MRPGVLSRACILASWAHIYVLAMVLAPSAAALASWTCILAHASLRVLASWPPSAAAVGPAAPAGTIKEPVRQLFNQQV